KLSRHNDEAGQLLFELYDFKGNLLEKTRSVIDPDQLDDPAFRVDWTPANAPLLGAADYQISTTYDALNRVTSLQYPLDVDGKRKKTTPSYTRAGAIKRVKLKNDIFVERIAYNEKGKRTLIVYGNKILTAYEYDNDTFRLRRMWTSAFTRQGT